MPDPSRDRGLSLVAATPFVAASEPRWGMMSALGHKRSFGLVAVEYTEILFSR